MEIMVKILEMIVKIMTICVLGGCFYFYFVNIFATISVHYLSTVGVSQSPEGSRCLSEIGCPPSLRYLESCTMIQVEQYEIILGHSFPI